MGRFFSEWGDILECCQVIVVEDNESKTFRNVPKEAMHFCHLEIDDVLGERSWIVPRKSDCIRSFGYYWAWKSGAKVIVTLDDDCYPVESAGNSFLDAHCRNLEGTVEISRWTRTNTVRTRGIPYLNLQKKYQCMISHGLWDGVLDYDAVTQLANTETRPEKSGEVPAVIPYGSYFPMCGMNLAWRAEFTPAMYFLLMGKGHGYDRFGDIWCGIIAKRICDHLGYAVLNGEPKVRHLRASNVFANLRKEAPGMEVNETLWEIVDGIRLKADSFGSAYEEIVFGLEAATKSGLLPKEWETQTRAMRVWLSLFR